MGSWHSSQLLDIFLEFGTSKMQARPFFRPVLAEIRAQGIEDFISDNTQTTVRELEDVDVLVRTLALAIERRVKEVITRKGLVDTGTLRSSVKAVKGADVSQLPSADEVDASAGVEVDV